MGIDEVFLAIEVRAITADAEPQNVDGERGGNVQRPGPVLERFDLFQERLLRLMRCRHWLYFVGKEELLIDELGGGCAVELAEDARSPQSLDLEFVVILRNRHDFWI